mmetsp:Transcript_65181/g.194331  ORF Transcript_65181/g.194331 Transcript_65181/m.194331 type:complete len:259 (+) Transcript_65181:178-954(+)
MTRRHPARVRTMRAPLRSAMCSQPRQRNTGVWTTTCGRRCFPWARRQRAPASPWPQCSLAPACASCSSTGSRGPSRSTPTPRRTTTAPLASGSTFSSDLGTTRCSTMRTRRASLSLRRSTHGAASAGRRRSCRCGASSPAATASAPPARSRRRGAPSAPRSFPRSGVPSPRPSTRPRGRSGRRCRPSWAPKEKRQRRRQQRKRPSLRVLPSSRMLLSMPRRPDASLRTASVLCRTRWRQPRLSSIRLTLRRPLRPEVH